MKISSKLDYSLRLLLLLADYPERYFSTLDISSKEGVSFKYLQAIVKQLKDANILQTHSGPNGGIRLAKHLEEISFLDIYEVFHKDLKVVEPCEEFTSCSHLSACGIQDIILQGQSKMRDYFANVTLLDLTNKNHDLISHH